VLVGRTSHFGTLPSPPEAHENILGLLHSHERGFQKRHAKRGTHMYKNGFDWDYTTSLGTQLNYPNQQFKIEFGEYSYKY